MNTIDRITIWGDRHHVGWLDFFRVMLGGILFFKGIEFGSNPREINGYFEAGSLNLYSFFIIQVVSMIHLAGGVMIATGLATRWAVAFQIPILVGAVALNFMNNDSFEVYSNLSLSIAVLVMLIVFLIYGSGPYSADEYFKKN